MDLNARHFLKCFHRISIGVHAGPHGTHFAEITGKRLSIPFAVHVHEIVDEEIGGEIQAVGHLRIALKNAVPLLVADGKEFLQAVRFRDTVLRLVFEVVQIILQTGLG